jgi:murein DD-endopeptidase MepM/ murein hydrolase activator NlpD
VTKSRSPIRWAVLAVSAVSALTALSALSGASARAAAPPSHQLPVATGAYGAAYAPPLAGPVRVLQAFAPPPTPYAAGHRGVDLAAADGATVLAAAAGTVTFAGTVADRGIVVVAHPDGLRTEYEPVRPLVTRGQAVARGDPIAEVSGSHAACAPASCLHWGARRGENYLDPMSLLSALGPVRLIPRPADSPG